MGLSDHHDAFVSAPRHVTAQVRSPRAMELNPTHPEGYGDRAMKPNSHLRATVGGWQAAQRAAPSGRPACHALDRHPRCPRVLPSSCGGGGIGGGNVAALAAAGAGAGGSGARCLDGRAGAFARDGERAGFFRTRVVQRRRRSRRDGEKWLLSVDGPVVPVDDIVLMPAVLPSPAGTPVPVGFPVRFRVEVSLAVDFSAAETVQDCTQADVRDPGRCPSSSRAGGSRAHVRVTAERLCGEPDNYFFVLGELVVCSGNRNVAEGARTTASGYVFDSPRWSLNGAVDGRSVAGRPVEDRSLPTNGYHGREEKSADVEQWVQVDLGADTSIDEVRLVAARPVDFPDTIGFGFPARFRVEVSGEASFSSATMVADHTAGADFPNPGDRHHLAGERCARSVCAHDGDAAVGSASAGG